MTSSASHFILVCNSMFSIRFYAFECSLDFISSTVSEPYLTYGERGAQKKIQNVPNVWNLIHKRDIIVCMGQYKVPQNVEAEDKILGPFSFRQFIYLLVALGCGAIMWFLVSSGAWPLIFIPLPVFVFCLVLALPLRKDQPMETYLLAILKFLIQPKKRLWRAGSFTPNVDVDAMTVNENPNLKDIRGADAANRLSFLAEVVDTAGWSTRGVVMDQASENMNARVAQNVLREADLADQFESTNQTAQIIDSKLSGSNQANPAIMKRDNV